MIDINFYLYRLSSILLLPSISIYSIEGMFGSVDDGDTLTFVALQMKG